MRPQLGSFFITHVTVKCIVLDALADEAMASASNARLEVVLLGREDDLRHVFGRFGHGDHQRVDVAASAVVDGTVELVPRASAGVHLTLHLRLQFGDDSVDLLRGQAAVARVRVDVVVEYRLVDLISLGRVNKQRKN